MSPRPRDGWPGRLCPADPAKELLESVDQPMTWGRFFDNLTGSLDRSSLRIPADPAQAARGFCH